MRREPSLVEMVRGVIRRAAQDLDELKMVTADEKVNIQALKNELKVAAPDSDDDEDSLASHHF